MEKPASSVEIKPSQIEGQGLYALRSFAVGEIVLRWDISHLIANELLDSLSPQERKYVHRFDEHRILIVQPPERYVNHSCNNNTEVRNFCDVAIREIAVGEEITSDYGSDGSGSKFVCRCGAANCRGPVR
jgi:SET domain-containing protein